MATKAALPSPLTSRFALLNKKPPSSLCPQIQTQFCSAKKKAHHFRVQANSGEEGGELKPKGKKKFITREEEPEQYWQSPGEREGENPMKTPIPYIIIFGMSTPFVILAIAFANGWIKVPVR